MAVAVHSSSTESTLKELTWSDDESDKEEVENVPTEEVDIKLKTSLEK